MSSSSSPSEQSSENKAPPKSRLVAITGITAFVVVAYLVYDFLIQTTPACGSILEQTSVQIDTKLKVLGAGTELKIGRQQLQALSAKAQLMAVNLEACCVVLSMGKDKVNKDEFLECRGAIRDYEDNSRDLLEHVAAASNAQKTGNSEQFSSEIEAIQQSLEKGARQTELTKSRIPTGDLRMQAVPTPGAEPVRSCFYVYNAEQDIDGNRVKVNEACDTTVRFTLNPGRYYVYANYGNADTSDEFNVTPGQLTNPVLDLNSGSLRMQAVPTQGADPVQACFYLFHAEQDIDGNRVKVNEACDTTVRFYLNAGRYYVYSQYGNADVGGEFEVTPGQLTNPVLDLNSGSLRMQAVPIQGAEPVHACFYLYYAEQDIDGNRVKVNEACDTTVRFYLNAGRYYVYSQYGNADANGEFEVTPGQLTNPVLELNSGSLRIQSVLNGGAEPVRACYYLYHAEQDIDGNRVKVNEACDTTARFYVNAGRYYVYSQYGDADAGGEFDVSPGQLSNHRMVLAQQ